MSELIQNSADTPEEFGTNGQGVVRRWLTELQMASREEKNWREDGVKILGKYRLTDRKKNAFNILYSNTETLRPALYNSLPQPDVRRRFKDADQIGRCVSDVLVRALQFSFDTTRFDEQIKMDVLDMLLPGRGVSRVRYIPSLVQVGDAQQTGSEENETDTEHEPLQGATEEVAWQQVCIEHVQWDDFRHGPGKTWDEVNWIAFRHYLTREELKQQFGDIGSQIPLTSAHADEVKALEDSDPVKELFSTAMVWEVWDKTRREVLFVCDAWRQGPIVTLDDPLKLTEFFPIPEPLRAVEDASSLMPTSLYSQYREQAEELDRVSIRLNKIIDALKVRGIYDSTMGNDIAQLLRGGDNDLIPATDVASWIEKGGIEKAIWFMPIEVASAVAMQLTAQREQTKQIIYDLTGIADLMRGQTDPNETASAQKLKSQWGSIRLQKMQRAVQRYIRDLVRLMAEIVAEHFTVDTLAQMTGLTYPTRAQFAPQLAQHQMMSAMASMQGSAAPPPPQLPTTWEDIIAVMRDDAARTFKVDIETDSTIAAAMQQDMGDLEATISSVVQIVSQLGPAVQAGILPFEAAKELTLSVVRRARLGNSVEDAIDTMQPPPPPPPDQKASIPLQVEQLRQQGEQQRIQAESQAKQAEISANAQADAMRAHLDAWVAQQEQSAQAAQAQQEQMLEAQNERLRIQNEAYLEQVRLQVDSQLEGLKQQMGLMIAKLNNATKIEVAEIAASTTLQTAQIGAANQGADS